MSPTSHTLDVRLNFSPHVAFNALRVSAPGVFDACTALLTASIPVSNFLLSSSLTSPTPSICNRPLMMVFVSMVRPFLTVGVTCLMYVL